MIATCALAVGFTSTWASAAPAASAVKTATSASATVDSGDGWTVERAAGGYVVTLKLNSALPVNDDAPVLVADGKVLGPAIESPDGTSLSLTTTDPAVASAGQIGWQWLSGGGDDTSKAAPAKAAPKSAAAAAKKPAITPSAALGTDPTTVGPFKYTEAVYNFGAQAIPLADIGGIRGEVEGKIYLPTGGGAHPLVIFLHGRHSSCFKSDPTAPTASGWPCPPGYSEIPSYAGYDGAGEALASNGYTVVSISANAINSNDNQLAPDDGAVARGQSVLDTLTWLKAANAGQPVSFHDAAKNQTLTLDQALTGTGMTAASLKGAMNFSSIGLMGHSRGGEGVVTAGTLNEGLAKPWSIKSIFALAPIDFTRDTLPDVVTTTLLPYCDGDVSDQQGQHFYSDSRDNFTDNVLRSNIWVMGADHDFFNSVWTPPFPSASDDWGTSAAKQADPVCGPAAPTTTRLSPTQEFQVGSAYVAGFFELTLGGQKQFQPMFDGTGSEPSSVAGYADVRTVADQPASQRDDITSFENTSSLVGTSGTATASVCASKTGRTVPESLPFCSVSALTNQQVPHWTPAAFAPNVPLGVMTHLTWTSGTGKLTATVPKAQQKVSGYQELTVDLSPDENVVTGTDLTLTVVDGKGHTYSALASSLNPNTVNRMPTSPGSTLLNKIVLQQIHLPTATIAAAGVDLNDVTSIGFTAAVGADATAAGGVYLSDLGFDSKGLGSTSVQTRPTVNVAATTTEEGDGPGSADVAVYLSKPSPTPITTYFSAIGSATGKVGLAMQKVVFRPGQTCQSIEIPTLGDTLAGATASTSFKMAVSDPTDAVLGANDYGALVIREDDGVTAPALAAPAVGEQGDVCAEFSHLSHPGTLAVSPSSPAAGQTVTLTGKGYRDGESVAFSLGSTPIGSAIAVPSGAVALPVTIPATAAGSTQIITAVGAGSGFTSSAAVKVRKSASSISLKLPASTTYGKAVTGSLHVTGAPSGTVTVSTGSTSVPVKFTGTATSTFALPATLSVGKHTITASYAGTDTIAAGTATGTVSVTKAASTLGLTLAKTSVAKGKSLTAGLTVSGHAGGVYPTGTLTITTKVGSKSSSAKMTLKAAGKGRATLKFTVPATKGKATVVASYAGDGQFTASRSSSKTITIS